ncbi:DUF2911 domain-containing protein [Telluribacter sp.]|jgi:hypothetical protein|uniref:DUF2911 domain-containing protein n=1 Tax=Telluribacter sp. TaxID=1978767 RepID=UPI002E130C93|nr:DUF2911 domain-containing protein [Telluribacter sp.]
MKKSFKWIGISLGVLVVLLFGAFKFMQYNTKKASPETTATYQKDGTSIEVVYSSPSKKGREIFGGLVPYGEIWRTGANEATTFTTNKALQLGGEEVPAGTYTLWTIPGKDNWTVLLNGQEYSWGLNFDGTSPRDPAADVAKVEVPVEPLANPVEQFAISFDEANPAMVLAWDKTSVRVPIK